MKILEDYDYGSYKDLRQLIELWGLNVQTEVESGKNLEKVSGRMTTIRTKSWPHKLILTNFDRIKLDDCAYIKYEISTLG